MKRIVCVAAMLLLAASAFPLTLYTRPVWSTSKTLVVPDDFPGIQTAIDYASGGDTIFVRNGVYHENLVVRKAVSLVGENGTSTIIDGGGLRDVVEVRIDNVTIAGFTIRGSRHQYASDAGVRIVGYSFCNVANNTFLNDLVSIYLERSNNNTIGNNDVVAAQQWYSIYLEQSNDNAVNANIIFNNTGDGIFLHDSNWNIIEGNNVTGVSTLPTVNGEGIGLFDGSHDNTIRANVLVDNRYSGLTSMNASGNTIEGNLIQNNMNGIYFYNSTGTKVYHNNFVNNSLHASLFDSPSNSLDNDYPSGGNYWSGYADIDVCRGPTQLEPGSDGIWDHPYVANGIDLDYYPLVNPWLGVQSHVKVSVSVFPNVLNLGIRSGHITCFIRFPSGVNPWTWMSLQLCLTTRFRLIRIHLSWLVATI